ncbi:testis-specific serine/threonine-protein kinase 1-like isoform X2 [Ischnura elegans]|uniref:testis-specific serine/threonine-protein kinase 1-like isoform X2 n=1 Tax=Ischnura elegans TaxID=197161 RepID=UPI001ED8BDC1|nr:testis-specific serine/threonine-protein kinase 1-like isoform X2 [Ischnura elegans]
MTNFRENFKDKSTEILNRYGYRLGQLIGQGSYCKVRTALKMTKGNYTKKLACKSIDKSQASLDYVQKFLPREIGILKKIDHPNIVTVHEIFVIGERVFIFMDICEKGDLLEYIRTYGPLPEGRAKQYFRQLVSALQYLHGIDLSHRDLKCENILLSSKNTIKITDFGFARRCRDDHGNRILSNTFCGSAAYAAPEIIQGMSYNPKMYDMWSIGCILYIMLVANMPFDDSNVRKMLKMQLNHKITYPSRCDNKVSSAARRLIWHLLEPDVTKRATIRQVARNPWLRPETARERKHEVTEPPPYRGGRHGGGDGRSRMSLVHL